MKKYLIVIEKTGNNLSAWFPDVPGCGTVGDTIDEVLINATEALAGHLEGELAPTPRTLKAILDEGIDLDGSEFFGHVEYVERSHATA